MLPAAGLMLAKLEQLGHLPRADVPKVFKNLGIQGNYMERILVHFGMYSWATHWQQHKKNHRGLCR